MAITLPALADKTTEYEDFYETTLAAPCTAADTDIYPTVLPSSAAGFLVMDPLGTNPEIIFFNFKGASFVRVPSAVDGSGRGVGNTTPRAYAQGTKIGMYSIAEFFEGIVTGVFMRDGFLQSRHFSAGIDPNSWIGTGETWNYVGNNGNKEYQYVTAGDKTLKYSNGMKVRMPRVTTVGTQCADLESTSSQYASRTSASVAGMTFTDDFTCEAWVKLESYGAIGMQILSRLNAAATQGWYFQVTSLGQLTLVGNNGATSRAVITATSLPLGIWIHVAGSMDMSGGLASLYVNGVAVPSTISGTGTALVQAGDLLLGNYTSNTQYFDGEMSDGRVWSAVRTQAQIRDNMHKQLIGTEPNLNSYFKLDGNFNDSTANANHLTGVGGAVATTLDYPLKSTEYGIITNLSFAAGSTTINVWCGAGHNAPYENLAGVAYSAAKTPYGFPATAALWRLEVTLRTIVSQTAPVANTFYNVGLMQLSLPSGSWRLSSQAGLYADRGAAGDVTLKSTIATVNNNETDRKYTTYGQAGVTTVFSYEASVYDYETIAAQALYYLNICTTAGGVSTIYLVGDRSVVTMRAECAYI